MWPHQGIPHWNLVDGHLEDCYIASNVQDHHPNPVQNVSSAQAEKRRQRKPHHYIQAMNYLYHLEMGSLVPLNLARLEKQMQKT